jgi:hypothetical protein
MFTFRFYLLYQALNSLNITSRRTNGHCLGTFNGGKFFCLVVTFRPPLWSSGHSSWLQIQRSGFDSRNYQKKKVMGLERGPLSLVSTTEELLDRKVAAPV